ncbi:hypothetical protein [Paraburkholderia sp. BR14320]|uniref:hypothetical protein n=1 Tax=unclassified Paraburkholderia TaxID=2615204 RepID=UPI0034CFE1FD
MQPNRYLDIMPKKFYGFLPVHVYDPSPGCYQQFLRDKNEPSTLSRENDLFYVKAALILRAARTLAGSDSATVIARIVERRGVTFESARRRWSDLELGIETRELVQRANSTVEACKRDLAGKNQFVDLWLNDSALIWQLAARATHDLAHLEAQSVELERTYGVPVPPFLESSCSDLPDWLAIRDSIFADLSGGKGWRLFNTLFFCLARGQSRGGILQYAYAHFLMNLMMRVQVRAGAASGGTRQSGRARKVRRTSISHAVPDDAAFERLLWKDFWQEFGRFFQDWYSRIRHVNSTFDDLEDAIHLSHELRIVSTWQVLEPDPPAEQISGLYPEPTDLRDRKSLREHAQKRSPSSPTNILVAARQIRQRPELLKCTWSSLPDGFDYFYLGVSLNPPMRFDGYIRRRRRPRLERLIRNQANVRRRILKRSRRGPGLHWKRRYCMGRRSDITDRERRIVVRKALGKTYLRRRKIRRLWRTKREVRTLYRSGAKQ